MPEASPGLVFCLQVGITDVVWSRSRGFNGTGFRWSVCILSVLYTESCPHPDFFLILKLLLPKSLLSPYFFVPKSTFLMSHKDSSSKGFKLILSDPRISFTYLTGLSLSKYNCISYILFVFLCNLVGNTCKHLLQKPNPRTQSHLWSYHSPKTNSHHLSSPDPHPLTIAFFSGATKAASVLSLCNCLVNSS